ncbi:DUF459 domain-containing protein [Solidesulfovibrio sp.]
MYPYARLAPLALLALLALTGCAKPAAKAPTGTAASPTEAAAPVESASLPPAEAAVKPAPAEHLPAALPPVMAAPPEPQSTPAPAVPEQATKQTLEPKPARTAALIPPRSEPVARTPDVAPAAVSKPAAAAAKSGGPAVAVVGDSLAVGVGMTMEQRLKKIEGLGCRPMGKVSTGLISKKYDWDKALAGLLAKEPISAVVVVLGGNDANNSIAGKAAGTPEWNAAYSAKAQRFLQIAADAKVRVLWVGLPAMKDADYSRRVAAVNAAAKTACANVAGCTYLEASDIFTDEAGNYVQAKDIGGKNVSLRAGDGVHMTMTGYDLLCRRVLDKLELTGSQSRP